MKSKIKKSINTKIWFYMSLFSILILLFLWSFQILFLDTYYEHRKASDMKRIATEINNNYKNSKSLTSFITYLENVSFKEGICIDINSNNTSYPISFMNPD